MDISKIHTTNASLKIFLIVIAIMSAMLLTMPAKAETGTVTLNNETSLNSYTYTLAGLSGGISSVNFTQLMIDNNSYNALTDIVVMPNGVLVYPYVSNATTFVISSGGTGHGVVSYSQYLNQIHYVFSSDTVITGKASALKYVNLTLATPIFNGFTITGASDTDGDTLGIADANHPACVVWGNTRCWAGGIGDTKAVRYAGNFTTTITHSYSVTYPLQGYFTIFVNKSNSLINTKDNIESQTTIYQTEGTFNNINFNSGTFQQLDGIYINLTISAGAFNKQLINSSGVSSIIPSNTSNPNAPNCVVNCIETSKPTYKNTESANIFGSFYPATTTVTDCLFFGFICTDKTISTESTTGYVFISTMGSTSPIKFLSFTPDLNSNYNIFTKLDIGTYQAQLIGFAGPGSTCTSGIVYDSPFIPLGCYYPHNITTFNVVNSSGNLSIVWQTKISNSTAIYGDTVSVAWSNVTPNDTVVIYDNLGAISQSYNINQSTVNQIPVFIPLYTIGTWNATIYNGTNHNLNVSAYLNVVPPGSVDVNNSFGITMYWSKAADIVGNPTLLNWNTGTYTGFYNISILQNGNEIRRNQYTGAPGQSQQASYTFGEQGAYVAQFLDINNTVQAQADIFISAVSNGGGGGGGVTPPSQNGNNLVGASNLIINLPWIGLMVLIVVIFGIIKYGVETGMAIFVIALTTSLEALIGLWQQWGIYITILSWLLVGIFFKMNRTIEE